MAILLSSLKIVRAETAEGACWSLSFGGWVPSCGSGSCQDRIPQAIGGSGQKRLGGWWLMKLCTYLCSLAAKSWKGVWVISRLLEVQEPTNGHRQRWDRGLDRQWVHQSGCYKLVTGLGVQWEKRTDTWGLLRETSQWVKLGPKSLLVILKNYLCRIPGRLALYYARRTLLPGYLIPFPWELQRAQIIPHQCPFLHSAGSWYSGSPGIGITWRAGQPPDFCSLFPSEILI